MNRLLSILLIAAALGAVAVGGAQGAEGSDAKVLVVLGGRAAQSPALIERARAAAERAHAQFRVAPTTGDELGTTHLFAARGYTAVVAVDLDARASVAPVAQRYPGTRFVSVAPATVAIDRALARLATVRG
jgi:basic membrane lipoprotein Med (substrate-binding protein (PBP1-ABC) superfamily)